VCKIIGKREERKKNGQTEREGKSRVTYPKLVSYKQGLQMPSLFPALWAMKGLTWRAREKLESRESSAPCP
jgi:hypothetical protein